MTICSQRVKDGKELVHDGKQVLIKQEGGLHTCTVNGVKRCDTGNSSFIVFFLLKRQKIECIPVFHYSYRKVFVRDH